MRVLDASADRALKVMATDEAGHDGANLVYAISGFDGAAIPKGSGYTTINFQEGPISDAGVNGVTEEALLAIVEDRLRSLLAGPFWCVDYEQALKAIVDARGLILTADRIRYLNQRMAFSRDCRPCNLGGRAYG